MKNLLLIFSVLLSTSLSAVEYGVLSLNNNFDNLIVLEEGDMLDIMSSYSTADQSSNGARILGVFYGTDSSLLLRSLYEGSNWSNISGNILWREDINGCNSNVRTLVGPMKVFITRNTYTGLIASFSYRLSRASEIQYQNANIVSVPGDVQGAGTHNIVVETSSDLLNWTPVHSSAINGGSEAFIRTRISASE